MIKLKPTATNIVIMLLIAILVTIGYPIMLIWALNTLVPTLAIPLTIETWLAAFIIPYIFRAIVTVNTK